MLVRFTYCWWENGRSACSNRDKCPWVWVCCEWAAVSRSWHRTIAYDKEDHFFVCFFPSESQQENPSFLRNTSAKSKSPFLDTVPRKNHSPQPRRPSALGRRVGMAGTSILLPGAIAHGTAGRDPRQPPLRLLRDSRGNTEKVKKLTGSPTSHGDGDDNDDLWTWPRPIIRQGHFSWDLKNRTDQERNQNLLNKMERIFFVSMWKIKQSNNQTIKQSNNQTTKQSNNQTIKASISQWKIHKKNQAVFVFSLNPFKKMIHFRAPSHILKSNETRNTRTKV